MTDTSKLTSPTRRRLLAVCAASTATLLPGIASSPQTRHVTWRGIALGAEAQIQLVHADEQFARKMLHGCVREISRLESIFSLYRPQSALNRLNRDGVLASPQLELVELMATALHFGDETDGAFDVSIQPLWSAYADHFAAPDADPDGPDAGRLQHALDLIDYRQIRSAAHQISYARPGMAVTLNGIAQGFITDRISALLNQNGFHSVLVHLGETYASGARSDGRPWQVGISAPVADGALLKKVNLRNRALATSGSYGHVFTPGGRRHHLFDPRTGLSTNNYKSVSVAAPSAANADALSTAFCAMPLAHIRSVLAHRAETQATIVKQDGAIIEL